MAIKNGTIWLWGYNPNGELGQNDVIYRSSPIQVGALTTWSQISAGATSMALKTDGTMWFWGKNDSGQVGDNTVINRSSPVQVGALTTWSKVFAGYYHNVAIKTDGTLWAWGRNVEGQLGQNNQIPRSSPVQIGSLTTWSQIAGGDVHSIATKTDGTLWAWGNGGEGRLGDNTLITRSSPVQIGALTTWSLVAGGFYRSLALKTDGTMWTWGFNSKGQLGDNTVLNRSSPVQVGALTTWSLIAGGIYHSSAIETDGSLYTWGNNAQGQLGINTVTSRSSPVQIGSEPAAEVTNWSKVALGDRHAAATKTNGTLWAWGYNVNGQLGDNTVITRSSPVQIGALTAWSLVAASGQYHTIATKTDGTIWTWGAGTKGQLGNNASLATNKRSSPVQVGALTTWSKITSGREFTAAIKTDTTLWTWGANNSSQLGENDTVYRSSPVQVGNTPVAETTNWSQVAGGASYFLATKTDGTMWAWGLGDNGQLGINIGNITRSSPVQVGALTTWSKLFSGGNTSLAIKTDGTLWTWGDNTYGNSGLNDASVKRSSPVQVGSGTTWNQIATGVDTTLATKTDGTLWSWGRNQTGQLGDNTVLARSSPVQVGSLTTWSKVAAGIQHFIATKTDGTLWSFGYNSLSGSLGDNTILNRSSPVQIGALTTWSKIASSRFASLAAKTDGTLWVWGYNAQGQLGQDDLNFGPLGATVNHRSSPVQIGALVYGWSLAAGGSYHFTGIKTNGTLWAWGLNTTDGQVGDNTVINKSSPVQIGADTTWSLISGGGYHTAATKTNGTMWLWGRASYGQLGDNTAIRRSSPIQLGALTTWSLIAGGGYHTLAIKTDGTLWGWGRNVEGNQLGLNNAINRSSPVQIGALTTWSKIAVRGGSTAGGGLAVKTDGTLWGWGGNSTGAVGDNSLISRSSPVQIGALNTWSLIAGGGYHSIAIKTDGTLWAWGRNDYGEIGNNTIIIRSSPVQIGALTTWSKINGASDNTVALKTDGTLWAWGRNNNGQIGDNTAIFRSSPVQVGLLNTWSKLAAGGGSFAAIETDGTWYSWGNNSYGQLGINRQTAGFNRSSPVQVGTNPALETTNWRRLSSSIGNQFYAITAD